MLLIGINESEHKIAYLYHWDHALGENDNLAKEIIKEIAEYIKSRFK